MTDNAVGSEEVQGRAPSQAGEVGIRDPPAQQPRPDMAGILRHPGEGGARVRRGARLPPRPRRRARSQLPGIAARRWPPDQRLAGGVRGRGGARQQDRRRRRHRHAGGGSKLCHPGRWLSYGCRAGGCNDDRSHDDGARPRRRAIGKYSGLAGSAAAVCGEARLVAAGS